MRVLIVGCGYVGLTLGAELARQGHEVFGLRRTAPHSELEAASIRPLTGDITKPESIECIAEGFDWVANCVAPSGGIEEYRKVYLEGMRNVLARLRKNPPLKFVYTSSTSVYGQNDGSLVDERSSTEPPDESARVLLETERLLLKTFSTDGFPAVALRVSGIYGPGRMRRAQKYLQRHAQVPGDSDRILNLIHRDDVALATVAALRNGRSGEIYNAVDDEPVSDRELSRWVANYLQPPAPSSLQTTHESRKRTVTNKRVANHKLKSELGYQFKYPTFREGYSAEIPNLMAEHAKGKEG